VKTPDADKPIGQLSGGNQQKVLLARWMATEPLLMLLDEPTRGVDVGAHADILRVVDSMRGQGMAVYVISSEIDELIAVANRVSVMRDRKQVRMLEGDDVSPNKILAAIADVPSTAGSAP
jgi:galactofuranose transport system ATP-binding protein